MSHTFLHNPETAVVCTRQGKVRGYLYDGISIFKGIPYGTAARFHAPEPVKPWEGVLEATSYGCVCPLLEKGKPTGELGIPHRYWVEDEDCLNLNLWTPSCDGGKRPVMVWLHGGGFEAGSSIEQIAYEGENMCRLGQTVVISINHRLNILGYFDLSSFGEEYANSGNAGTDDIILALKWIRENAAAFGGDPENVTLFGQSGGGAKITTLLQTPAADGLFARGINMSGVVDLLLTDQTGSGEELAKALMRELMVTDVRELETVPYAALAAAYRKVKPRLLAAGSYVGCAPHPNAFYLGSPSTAGFRPQTAKLPLMVGTVFGEFTAFSPLPCDRRTISEEESIRFLQNMMGAEYADRLAALFREAYPDHRLIDLASLDFVFRGAASSYIRQRSALNDCTYSYLFDQELPLNGGTVPWHCADIPFFFHNTELIPVTQIEGVTERLEQQMFDSVMAFARTGNPNHASLPHWPASTPEAEYTMLFQSDSHVVKNHDHALLPLYAKVMTPIFLKNMERDSDKIQH